MHFYPLLSGLLLFVLTSSGHARDTELTDCLVKATSGDSSRVASAGDFLYDVLHVQRYNLYYEIIPAAIVYPKDSSEVSQAVICAAAAGLKVQARSGGHSYGDYCIGGVSGAVVIDLQHLNTVKYNPQTLNADIGPGCLLADVDKSLAEVSRVIVHGTAPQVGVGGHFTIGGLGPLSRQFGTAADQILSAEVVLANGSIVEASLVQNPDLFFALRGAGASVGIVTRFNVMTYAIPPMAVQFTYNITLGDQNRQAAAFKAWQKMTALPDLPWTLSSQFFVFEGGAVYYGTFFGSQPEFDSLNIDLQLGENGSLDTTFVGDVIGILGEQAIETTLQLGGGVPSHFYAKSLEINRTTLLSDDAIDDMFESIHSADKSGLLWFVLFDSQGGAINNVPADATAYPFRDTVYFMQSYAIDVFGMQQTKTMRFLDGLVEVMKNHVPGIGGAYPGYVDPFLADAQSEYWRGNLPRLMQIKTEVDPTDVFNNPQSVPLLERVS